MRRLSLRSYVTVKLADRSVFRELLQNADDAGVSVSIRYWGAHVQTADDADVYRLIMCKSSSTRNEASKEWRARAKVREIAWSRRAKEVYRTSRRML